MGVGTLQLTLVPNQAAHFSTKKYDLTKILTGRVLLGMEAGMLAYLIQICKRESRTIQRISSTKGK